MTKEKKLGHTGGSDCPCELCVRPSKQIGERKPGDVVPQRACSKCGLPCNVEVCAACASGKNPAIQVLLELEYLLDKRLFTEASPIRRKLRQAIDLLGAVETSAPIGEYVLVSDMEEISSPNYGNGLFAIFDCIRGSAVEPTTVQESLREQPGATLDTCAKVDLPDYGEMQWRLPEKASGEYCGNWPCRLLRYHVGPCNSSPENGDGDVWK